MKKYKFWRIGRIFLVVCMVEIFGYSQNVMAKKHSEEAQAYLEYERNGGFEEATEGMYDLGYAVVDLDRDGVDEFIIKGKNEEEYNEYIFYRYKENSVQLIGSFESGNLANGELYITRKKGTVAVFTGIADLKIYSMYSIGEDNVEKKIYITRQDVPDSETGKQTREYTSWDADNNKLDMPVSNEEEWTEFKNELKEIKFDVQTEGE